MRDKDSSRALNVALPMTTLDRLTNDRNITHVDLFNLDVHGAEMLVLQGSEATLVSTEFVLIELSFQELYDQAPLAISVINFMDKLGFQLYDLCSMMRRPKDKALAQIDALFVTRRSSFASSPGWK